MGFPKKADLHTWNYSYADIHYWLLCVAPLRSWGVLPGREPLYHGLSPIEAVIAHLQDYPIARWSKLAEFLLLAVLVLLYRRVP